MYTSYLSVTRYLLGILLCAYVARAQRTCTGSITGGVVTSDVLVNKGSCVLQGVNVTGSVTIENGAVLSTLGKTFIFGSIRAIDSGALYLGGKLMVGGGLSATNSPMVWVGAGADMGSMSISNVKSTIIQGSTTLLESSGAGDVNIRGGKVNGGGILRTRTTGNLQLCGGFVRGGVKITEAKGDFLARASRFCAPTSIMGTISVEKSEGQFSIQGGELTGADVLVNEHTGNVVVNNARVSDVNMARINGSVSLSSMIADSDGLVAGVLGTVFLTKSRFDGDFAIIGNKAVTVTRNDFGLEVVSISGNSGPVKVTQNTNFSIILNENGNVDFSGNSARTVEIGKNKGTTTVNMNTANTMSCVENQGLSGNRNSAIFTTGQCVKM